MDMQLQSCQYHQVQSSFSYILTDTVVLYLGYFSIQVLGCTGLCGPVYVMKKY